jgi:hypothetical protein
MNLTLNGNVNFSPSADPQTPGSVSFAGNAKDDNGTEYLLGLTGSTYQLSSKDPDKKPSSALKFTLSGSMTRGKQVSGTTVIPDIGFSPTINLVGSVVDANDSLDVRQRLCGLSALFDKGKGQLKNLCGVSGLLTSSAELPTTSKISLLIGAPVPSKLKGTHFAAAFTAAAGGGGASGAAASKSTGSSSASSGTQFGSLVNFMLSYGVEGGPNWTLSNFKGPGGGTGTSGQLLSVSRSHTDSATITFVAACQDDINVERFDTYWQTIPKCNGTQQVQAANAGAQYNFLLQTGRGGH